MVYLCLDFFFFKKHHLAMDIPYVFSALVMQHMVMLSILDLFMDHNFPLFCKSS